MLWTPGCALLYQQQPLIIDIDLNLSPGRQGSLSGLDSAPRGLIVAGGYDSGPRGEAVAGCPGRLGVLQMVAVNRQGRRQSAGAGRPRSVLIACSTRPDQWCRAETRTRVRRDLRTRVAGIVNSR